MGFLIPLLVLVVVVVGVVAVLRKVMDRRGSGPDEGGDVIAYLLMAVAVGVAAFALVELGQAAFPGDRFVSNTDRLLATSLAALVVASPVAAILWRRQAQRRATFPASGGWTVYLALIEAVFMTSFVVAAVSILNWLLADASRPVLTDVVVFAGVLLFHEIAARRTPPMSDAAELPRVVGSAVGLITTAVGLAGTLTWLLDRLYSSFQATAGGPGEIGTWLALLIVGLPVWWYRWLRPWPAEPATPRFTWMFFGSVAGLLTAIGSAVWLVSQTLVYLTESTEPAGTYFDTIPAVVSIGGVGLLVWTHHRRRLGVERTNPVRAYQYALAAAGLLWSVGAATALTAIALGPADFIDADPEALIPVTVVLVTSLALWGWFWRKAAGAPREIEAGTLPRRFYLIGLAILTGMVSAGALIGTLVVLFQRLLDVGTGETLVVQASLFVYSGLATWHLLRTNAVDRDLIVSEEVITPYKVTLICSHPGMIATTFPKEARLQVIYRADDTGVIDEELARAIVEAVGHRSSLVWVDDDGFRVAPAR